MKKINLVEQVHAELATALENKCIKASLKVTEIDANLINSDKLTEYVDDMKKFGFGHSSVVKQSDKTKQQFLSLKRDNQFKKELNNALEKIKLEFPYHKLITYTALHLILEKYNLYLGPVSKFIKNVPTKNLKELNDFSNLKFKEIKWIIANNVFMRDITPVFIRETPVPGYTIAATQNCFDLKDSYLIGRELSYDLKKPKLIIKPKFEIPEFNDPIILAPFLMKNIVMFVIITAWGKEAEDIEIFNELNN